MRVIRARSLVSSLFSFHFLPTFTLCGSPRGRLKNFVGRCNFGKIILAPADTSVSINSLLLPPRTKAECFSDTCASLCILRFFKFRFVPARRIDIRGRARVMFDTKLTLAKSRRLSRGDTHKPREPGGGCKLCRGIALGDNLTLQLSRKGSETNEKKKRRRHEISKSVSN